jgi:hypothetical protein
VTPDAYCREIEGYLTRKNDGHLIRIVGPSFARVCGWAEQGVPLKIAFAGIDRYFERYYAKGARRRPVHIDFCEDDVLDMFDAWRRAVGVTAGASEQAAESRPRESLATRLERAIAKLTALRAGPQIRGPEGPPPQDLLNDVVRELDQMLPSAKQARGAARAAMIDRMARLDRQLLEAARAGLSTAESDRLKAQAETDLAPFRDRMPSDAWTRAIDAAFDRLVREHTGLPALPQE